MELLQRAKKTEIIGTGKEGKKNEEIPTDKTQAFGGNSPVNVPNGGFSGPDPSLLKQQYLGRLLPIPLTQQLQLEEN